MRHFHATGRTATLAAVTVAALVVAGGAGSTSFAAGSGGTTATGGAARSPRGGTSPAALGFVDVRTQNDALRATVLRRVARAAHAAQASPSTRSAPATTFPGRTILDIDGTTGTVRMLARLDGYLTDPSTSPPQQVVLSYVAAHEADLGLSPADLATFHLHRDYRDITGTHHLYFTQQINGHTVVGNGLTAAVTKAGQLLTVGGSPVATANAGAAPAPVSPRLATAGQALARARTAFTPAGTSGTGDHTTSSTSQDGASRGVFLTGSGLQPVWQTVTMSGTQPAYTVLDASTGRVLLRQPLVDYESANPSTGLVYRYFPHARRGGTQTWVNFTRHHWLTSGAKILAGNNAHAFSDVNDNNRASASEEVHPRSGQSWGYRLQPFHLSWAKAFCSNPWPCSWNPDKAYSWKVNRAQNATQVFYYVNNWHDHLKAAPIGFTEAAGNFQQVNHTKRGKGGDRVTTQTDDGANTDHGLPDSSHIDNANMATPPDGHHPVMQMYLQHQPFTRYSTSGDPFSPTNVGDEADTVYHEYTHGLSNRLVVDVQGHSTLGGVQAGAMGEAWSDWYAMDYLVAHGFVRDRRTRSDVRLFPYDGLGANFDRSEPIDCQVGHPTKLCQGGATGHRGGYTYADYGKVYGFPEVHGDGEIWAQTLWSLRYALGSKKTESVVTRAMELAPYNPSFLDMRNAILVADTAVFQGQDRGRIWHVFASRGMGYYAGSFGGNDTSPAASFATPPATPYLTTIQGTVTAAGQPVAGLTVKLAFQAQGAVNPTAVTDASGHYVISGVPAGSYLKLQVGGTGYHSSRTAVTVPATPAGATQDFSVTAS